MFQSKQWVKNCSRIDNFLSVLSLRFLITNPAETVTITGETFLIGKFGLNLTESFWTARLKDQGVLTKLFFYETFYRWFSRKVDIVVVSSCAI